MPANSEHFKKTSQFSSFVLMCLKAQIELKKSNIAKTKCVWYCTEKVTGIFMLDCPASCDIG
jgi:hypothetical protein